MKAIILKPVVWNSENYLKPSGHIATGGFTKEYGYGHEEWNSSPKNIWRGQRVFHTETTDKLFEYSKNGDLGIIPIASYDKAQYALGIATNVSNNSKELMELICDELNIFERHKELWDINNVKKCFQNDEEKFMAHWKKHHKWLSWRCPSEHFSWFKEPIPLNPKKITGKTKLTTRHGTFQAITPLMALKIIEKHLPKNHCSSEWLVTGEFDEELTQKIPENRKSSSQKLRKKFKIRGANAPSEKPFDYWVKGKRVVNPHHAILQAKFTKYLKGKGIIAIENDEYIDVQYVKKGKLFFSEIKPTETVESKYAIRFAIGQLLEYRFSAKKKATLEIVIGSKPKKKEIEFIKSIKMKLTYYDKEKGSFITE